MYLVGFQWSWKGEWASGKPHGHGTATHKDGEKYVGTYKAGLYHGEGEDFPAPCEGFSRWGRLGEERRTRRETDRVLVLYVREELESLSNSRACFV